MPETRPFSPTIMLLTVSRPSEAALSEGLKPLGLTLRKYGCHPGWLSPRAVRNFPPGTPLGSMVQSR